MSEDKKQNMHGLNSHLFEQLNRLANADLKGDALKIEIERSKAMSGVAKDIIGSARLELEARQYIDQGMRSKKLPEVLSIGPAVPK